MLLLKNAAAAKIPMSEKMIVFSDGVMSDAEKKYFQEQSRGNLLICGDVVKKGFSLKDHRHQIPQMLNSIEVHSNSIKTGAFKKMKTTNFICNAQTIHENSFVDTFIENLTFLEKTECIKSLAFSRVRGLKTVTLDKKINFIGQRAFADSNIEKLIIGGAGLCEQSLEGVLAKEIHFIEDNRKKLAPRIVLHTATKLLVIDDPDFYLSQHSVKILKNYHSQYNLTIKLIRAKEIQKDAILIQTETMDGITILDSDGNQLTSHNEIICHKPKQN